MRFKHFLLHENTVYLGQRVGDILNALQELEQNSSAMGTRVLVRSAETVVNQIRRLLHTAWPKEDERYLKTLQKVGVGIMKAIEEKDDLPSVIATCSSEVQQVLTKIGEPTNQIATPEGKEAHDEEPTDQTAKAEKPDRKPPQQPQDQSQQQPPQAPMAPGQPPPEGAGTVQPGVPPSPQGMPGFSLPGA